MLLLKNRLELNSKIERYHIYFNYEKKKKQTLKLSVTEKERKEKKFKRKIKPKWIIKIFLFKIN